MSSFICTTCRASLQKATRIQERVPINTHRKYSTDPASKEIRSPQAKKSKPRRFRKLSGNPKLIRPIYSDSPSFSQSAKKLIKAQPPPPQKPTSKALRPLDIAALLSTPSWSVRSLFPPTTSLLENEITPRKLHHLLRLSALPLPKNPEEEEKMLETLHSQLHFVRDIQKVDTEGVEPMYSVRDESEEGVKGTTIGVEDLKGAFEEEEVRGRNRRSRRKREGEVGRSKEEEWDVFAPAGRTVDAAGGRYFVVRSGKV